MSLYSQARLKEKTAEELVSSGTFPYFNQAEQLEPLAGALHAFDKAHTLMLAEEGLIPHDVAAHILQALLAIEDETLLQKRVATGEGIHSGEAYLRAALGPEVAGYIHLGRSTPDLKGIPVRMAMRARLLALSGLVLALRQLMLERSEQHKGAIMPSYDRVFQRGEATTFGSEMVESLDPLERAYERMEGLYDRVNRCPPYYINYLGFQVNSARIAELLGFVGRVESVLNWDDIVECLSTLCTLNRCLSSLAAKLGHWFSPEVGLIEIADRYCVTSSIRPQKRNPAALEFVVGAEGSVVGHLTACLTLLRGIGAEAYQMSVLHLWPALALSTQACKVMLGVLSSVTLNEAQMKRRAEEEWGQAPYLAARIVEREAVSWRSAHQIVAEAIRQSADTVAEDGIDKEMLDRISRKLIGRELSLSSEEIDRALHEPQIHIRVQHVEDTLARLRQNFASDRARLERRAGTSLDAERQLQTAVTRFVQDTAPEPSVTN